MAGGGGGSYFLPLLSYLTTTVATGGGVSTPLDTRDGCRPLCAYLMWDRRLQSAYVDARYPHAEGNHPTRNY